MTTPAVPSFTLNNGTKIPALGMGCWMGIPGGGERVYDMVTKALEKGYRYFDTASGYDNEEQVGKAIKDSGIPRGEIYITTKLGNDDHHRVQEAFAESLQKLDSEYIDLYLMHWPQASKDDRVLSPEESPTIVETWKEMEKMLQTGKVKTLGISNFSIKTLKELLPHCSVIPATNQVELHPFLPSTELKALCEEHGRPKNDGTPGLLNDPTVVEIAQRNNADPAQVVLSWIVQHKIIVVPKTENESRMTSNITLLSLSKDDMDTLDHLHQQPGKHRSLLTYFKDGRVFGWTYEQLGWNVNDDGVVTSN
ncbi:hypothetical protein VNI00_007485 [Paramarasmius palmivorus]|uniref:NADP-dependent oxidoreductase domain-containing protein n=1 Tax=Paramarasmius palmivorus TaxID=297713 RepID=A0AAW0D3Q5_9AGAR